MMEDNSTYRFLIQRDYSAGHSSYHMIRFQEAVGQ